MQYISWKRIAYIEFVKLALILNTIIRTLFANCKSTYTCCLVFGQVMEMEKSCFKGKPVKPEEQEQAWAIYLAILEALIKLDLEKQNW